MNRDRPNPDQSTDRAADVPVSDGSERAQRAREAGQRIGEAVRNGWAPPAAREPIDEAER